MKNMTREEFHSGLERVRKSSGYNAGSVVQKIDDEIRAEKSRGRKPKEQPAAPATAPAEKTIDDLMTKGTIGIAKPAALNVEGHLVGTAKDVIEALQRLGLTDQMIQVSFCIRDEDE